MIIDSVGFYNVGAFKGHQSVQLTPSSPGHIPIVLIGGQNGRGKTTLLDGIHYALYGRKARLAKQGNLSWDDFLRGLVHRHAPSGEGAAIVLSFRYKSEGNEHQVKIQREWKVGPGKVKETMTVWMDGGVASDLVDAWDEFIENLIPSRIAHLFLFDGEQIAALADPEKSRDILRTGIYGLLGADLLERLEKDLSALARRHRLEAAPEEQVNELKRAEANHLDAMTAVRDLEEAIKTLQAAQLTALNDRDQTQAEIHNQGGHLIERREVLEQEEKTLLAQIAELEEEIRKLQGGLLPLVPLEGLLEEIAIQAEKEISLRGGKEWLSKLEIRDQSLLSDLKNENVLPSILSRVEAWLCRDRNDVDSNLRATEMLYDFSQEGYAQLQHLLHGGLSATSGQNDLIQARLVTNRDNLEVVQRKLARIPDPEAVYHLLEKRTQVDQQLHRVEEDIRSTEFSLSVAVSNLRRIEKERDRQHSQLESIRIGTALLDRNLTHIERARTTVNKFKESLVARDILRIEEEILKSARILYSKKKLVSRVSIDPATFQITIYDSLGDAFSAHQLSAGERQILAISILWGLSTASGKTLPIIIDTPLGRLDHRHRENLVSSYFHEASHQVVLLSTEEEITPEFYRRLAPWVGRICSLIYSEETQSSHFEPNRFFDDIKQGTITPLFGEELK